METGSNERSGNKKEGLIMDAQRFADTELRLMLKLTRKSLKTCLEWPPSSVKTLEKHMNIETKLTYELKRRS